VDVFLVGLEAQFTRRFASAELDDQALIGYLQNVIYDGATCFDKIPFGEVSR